jgi:hypothetical protein
MDLRRLNHPRGPRRARLCRPKEIQVEGPPLASGRIEAETPVST